MLFDLSCHRILFLIMCNLAAADLDKPVTKNNYFTETKAQLFSHFHMMQEVKNDLAFIATFFQYVLSFSHCIVVSSPLFYVLGWICRRIQRAGGNWRTWKDA